MYNGIHKLVSGRSAAITEAVPECLKNRNLSNKIQSKWFDTTVTNAEKKQLTCSGIEDKVNRSLFHFAYQHDIKEIISSDIFLTSHGNLDGSEISLFKRFKINCESFVKDKVHETRIPDLDTLQRRIADSIADVIQAMFHRTWWEIDYCLNTPRETKDASIEVSLIYIYCISCFIFMFIYNVKQLYVVLFHFRQIIHFK